MNFIPILFKGAILFVSSDFVTIDSSYPPANGVMAEEIADDWDAILPTPELVDEIYNQATCRVVSPALDPAKEESYAIHERAIKRNMAKCMDKTLVAGHKKTIVQSDKTNRVAIYGWFNKFGQLIQPYSTVHDKHYADYSHGIRLIKRKALMNGKVINADEIMSSLYLSSK